MFTTAKKEKISKLIFEQIRTAILSGKIKPGEALPPEKEMIVQFGVSRHTLREALRALESLGLIQIKRGAGGGPVVQEIDLSTARKSFATFLHFHDISIRDLSEVRKLIEPYLAQSAAENFDDQARAELMAIHEQCQRLCEKKINLVSAKEEIMFHVLLAQKAGNPLLWVILDFVNNILGETKSKMKPGLDFSWKVQEAHQRILAAILARDGQLAARCMYEHICEVEDALQPVEPDAGSSDIC